MLGENATDIEIALMAAQSELMSITTVLEGVVTSKELGLISSALADLQEDINEILENNSVVTQNININNVPSLELAETLINTTADAPNVILDGSLNIEVGVNTFTPAQLDLVNAVTAKLAIILSNVNSEND
jgi:hypothetical protein